MDSEATNRNLKVVHHHTIPLVITDSLVASNTRRITPPKTPRIEATKRIIEATEHNNQIARRHMILLVTTDSLVALSIQMIDETSHISNAGTEPYRQPVQLTSSNQMRHMGQTTMHHMTICRQRTTASKTSLHTTLTSPHLRTTLMFSSMTPHSHGTATHPIRVVHAE